MLDSNSLKKMVEAFHSSEKAYWDAPQLTLSNVITSKQTDTLLLRFSDKGNVFDIMLKPKDIVICSSHAGMDVPITIDTIEDAFRFLSLLFGIKIPDPNNY